MLKLFTRLYSVRALPNEKNKDLMLSVLKSAATRREARDYLTKYPIEKVKYDSSIKITDQLHKSPVRTCVFIVRDGDSKKVMPLAEKLQDMGIHPIIIGDGSGSVDTILERTGDQYQLTIRDQLLTMLLTGKIPILSPKVFNLDTFSKETVSRDEFLARLVESYSKENEKYQNRGRKLAGRDNGTYWKEGLLSFEKIIIIDKGIPSLDRKDKASHIFINLSQEYGSICEEIKKTDVENKEQHLENLKCMETVLQQLPSNSTGIITDWSSVLSSDMNPIIHNILTDRTVVSCSLPMKKKEGQNNTTVLKKGVDIKFFDSPTIDPNLDLVKFKGLIDDSFGRSLDLNHYLNRINGNIASIIIIGDYDGVAIITREGDEKFVYLDKFAVSSRLKGSLGISDIIFNVMFKKFGTVVWRSRKENVVNKWYFQRSLAVVDLGIDFEGNKKQSGFKMFYYSDTGVVPDLRSIAITVRDIQPSWEK